MALEMAKQLRALEKENARLYNHGRPHSSLDYDAPAAFAARCLTSAP